MQLETKPRNRKSSFNAEFNHEALKVMAYEDGSNPCFKHRHWKKMVQKAEAGQTNFGVREIKYVYIQ